MKYSRESQDISLMSVKSSVSSEQWYHPDGTFLSRNTMYAMKSITAKHLPMHLNLVE